MDNGVGIAYQKYILAIVDVSSFKVKLKLQVKVCQKEMYVVNVKNLVNAVESITFVTDA
jgi:hypothetical protein